MISPLPLTPINRLKLARAFHGVPRVDPGIDCVLEEQMGSAYLAGSRFNERIVCNSDAANPESCRLAERLGYERADSYDAYTLAPEDAG
jgi:hypothetical protein